MAALADNRAGRNALGSRRRGGSARGEAHDTAATTKWEFLSKMPNPSRQKLKCTAPLNVYGVRKDVEAIFEVLSSAPPVLKVTSPPQRRTPWISFEGFNNAGTYHLLVGQEGDPLDTHLSATRGSLAPTAVGRRRRKARWSSRYAIHS